MAEETIRFLQSENGNLTPIYCSGYILQKITSNNILKLLGMSMRILWGAGLIG